MNQRSPQTFTARQREREAARMALYGALFAHWRDCRLARCRRARACRGEASACFRRWWRALGEEEREAGRARVRAVMEAGEARPAHGRGGRDDGQAVNCRPGEPPQVETAS